jgi:hypothetical protein
LLPSFARGFGAEGIAVLRQDGCGDQPRLTLVQEGRR